MVGHCAFCPDNGVLRAWGNLEKRGFVPAYSQIYRGEDVRGRFTTTIHVINSGVLKLSRLQPAVTVFRGISGMKLPKRFIEKDNVNVRGGVEYAFMSTTTDESVALGYAKGGDRSTATTLIEAAMGMVDRGASLDWLSQYPHEREILLPPLTAMEVIDITDYESADSIEALDSESFLVRRLKIRLNCNLISSTIEKLLAVRKKQVEELAQIVEKDIETQKKHIDAADIDRRQDELETTKTNVTRHPAAAFNDNSFLIEKMDRVLGLLPKVGDEIEVLKNHRLEVFGLVALATKESGINQGFASSSWDGTVLLWQLNRQNQYVQHGQLVLEGESLALTCIDPKTCRLASGQFDGSIKIQTCSSNPSGETIDVSTAAASSSTRPLEERVSLVTRRNQGRHTRAPITALGVMHQPPRAIIGARGQPLGYQQLLASGSMDGEICVWDISTNREVASIGGAKYSSQQQDEGGDAGLNTSLSSSPREDSPAGRSLTSRTGSLYTSSDLSDVDAGDGHKRTVRALLWLTIQGQPKLISCSFDRTICIWGIASPSSTTATTGITLERTLVDNSCLHCAAEGTAHRGAVTSLVDVDLSHVSGQTARVVASASEDSTIKLWNISSTYATDEQTALVRVLRCPAGCAGVCSLVWMPLPNGENGPAGWLASGHGNHAIVVHKLFDRADGLADLNYQPSVVQVSLRGHTAPVHALVWLPDRGWLVSGSTDATIRTWRMRTVSE